MRAKTETKIRKMVHDAVEKEAERTNAWERKQKGLAIDYGPHWASEVDGEGNYTVLVYGLVARYNPWADHPTRPPITKRVVLSLGKGRTLDEALAACEKKEAKRLRSGRLKDLTSALNKETP